MKNQYFGDKRDLFKFDLLLDLMESGCFRQLTYVPMLTRGDATGQGKLAAKDGVGHRPTLFSFLSERRSARELDIRHWREYFSQVKGIVYRPYRDDHDDYSFEGRNKYFGGIDADVIEGACILVDPDIGLQRRTRSYMGQRGLNKYLFVEDLARLFERSRNAVIIIYQHLQKDARHRLIQIGSDVEVLCKSLCLKAVPFIRDGDLAFYAVSRDESLVRSVAATFFSHAEKIGRLQSHVTDILQVAKATLNPDIGISGLAVFGSVARGEQGQQSDIDVIVSFDKPATLRGYFSVQRLLENTLGREVDLVTEKALRPEMRQLVERDAIHAA